DPVGYHERARAAGVLRPGDPQPERVRTVGQYRARPHEMVAAARRGVEVDVLLRAAVHRHGADAVLGIEDTVERDLGTGEGDRRRVPGGAVPAVAVVEEAGVAARAAVLPPGAVVREVGVVDTGDARTTGAGGGGDREVVELGIAPLAHQQADLTVVVRAVGDRRDLGAVD